MTKINDCNLFSRMWSKSRSFYVSTKTYEKKLPSKFKWVFPKGNYFKGNNKWGWYDRDYEEDILEKEYLMMISLNIKTPKTDKEKQIIQI